MSLIGEDILKPCGLFSFNLKIVAASQFLYETTCAGFASITYLRNGETCGPLDAAGLLPLSSLTISSVAGSHGSCSPITSLDLNFPITALPSLLWGDIIPTWLISVVNPYSSLFPWMKGALKLLVHTFGNGSGKLLLQKEIAWFTEVKITKTEHICNLIWKSRKGNPLHNEPLFFCYPNW